MKNAETCHTQNVFSYRLIPSSWPDVLYRVRFDRKGANRRFGFCPDFTGVEQCFRNIEDAMGHFILFPFRLTLTLARWLCIKGVTFRMKKALATWCPTLNEPKVFQAFKLSPTFLYFGAYLGRFPTFFNMFGQYTDNLARKMGTPVTHTTHIRWLHIRKKQSTHIYIWTLPRCPYLILTPFSSLHMCIQNIHAFFL